MNRFPISCDFSVARDLVALRIDAHLVVRVPAGTVFRHSTKHFVRTNIQTSLTATGFGPKRFPLTICGWMCIDFGATIAQSREPDFSPRRTSIVGTSCFPQLCGFLTRRMFDGPAPGEALVFEGGHLSRQHLHVCAKMGCFALCPSILCCIPLHACTFPPHGDLQGAGRSKQYVGRFGNEKRFG